MLRAFLILLLAFWLLAYWRIAGMTLVAANSRIGVLKELSIFSSLVELRRYDEFLFWVVFLAGVVLPVGKVLMSILLLAWPRLQLDGYWRTSFSLVARFAMLDVFVIAILIVGVRGLGFGHVVVRAGMVWFVALMLSGIALSYLVERTVSSGMGRA
jgi:uncharacterized paraquat-inducible protein A